MVFNCQYIFSYITAPFSCIFIISITFKSELLKRNGHYCINVVDNKTMTC